MVNPGLCWVAAAAMAVARLGAVPALPAFDSSAVSLPPLSLHGQADGALADQLHRRLTDPPWRARGAQPLHRAPAPIDHMPIARGQSIDAQMVHAPDDRYDYKLIIVTPGEPTRPR